MKINLVSKMHDKDMNRFLTKSWTYGAVLRFTAIFSARLYNGKDRL